MFCQKLNYRERRDFCMERKPVRPASIQPMGRAAQMPAAKKNIQQDVDDGAGIWRNYDEIKKHLETEMGALASDVRADHHSGILRNNSGRDSASDAALGFPKRPWLILLGCTVYGSVCGSA